MEHFCLAHSGAGVPNLDKDKKKGLIPLCHCGEDRAACGACGKGYAQEVAAGRAPKMGQKEVTSTLL